jgi:hypothetical protein
MKTWYPFLRAVLIALTALAALGGCDVEAADSPFLLDLPPLPASWTELLGTPRWLVRYYGQDGREVFLDFEGERPELSPPLSRVGTVTAWPYWPLWHLEPGDFRPAGAILPYDVPIHGDGPGRILLSWQGGVEARFFDALNRVDGIGDAEDRRQAERFNWPAFRLLFSDLTVSEEFRADPWLADWDAIAEKTVRSGFRKQQLGIVETRDLNIPAPGPWVSPSPFAMPAEETVKVREGSTVQAWYSAQGILHCAGANWILLPWN